MSAFRNAITGLGVLFTAERKTRADKQLQENYRNLVESIGDAFLTVDHDWRVLLANGCASTYLLIARDQLAARKTLWDLFPETIGTVFETECRRVMLERDSATFDIRLIRAKTYSQVRVYANLDGISIFFHDITDRKRTEEALAKSEERYRTFIQHSTEGIWRIELEEPIPTDLPERQQVEAFYRYAYLAECNDTLARMYGFDAADQFVGTRAEGILLGATPQNDQYIREFISLGYRLNEVETCDVDGDRNIRYFVSNVVGIVENGALRRGWVTQRDISDRKRLQEAQQRFSEELARSNENLEQFAYAASHELQEPLRSIVGYVQLLVQRHKGKLDSQTDEYLENLEKSANRMRGLIVDLLAFSHVVHSSEDALGRADCNAALRWSLMNLSIAMTESGARVEHGDLPVVRGDSSQIAQLFQNLIGNAIKYRGQQPPRVMINAECSGGEWRFSVRDNGIGIDPRYSTQIFGIFKRLHGSEYPGTGIGLALCKRIVERHGGRLWVESQLGQGADFRFTLPALED